MSGRFAVSAVYVENAPGPNEEILTNKMIGLRMMLKWPSYRYAFAPRNCSTWHMAASLIAMQEQRSKYRPQLLELPVSSSEPSPEQFWEAVLKSVHDTNTIPADRRTASILIITRDQCLASTVCQKPGRHEAEAKITSLSKMTFDFSRGGRFNRKTVCLKLH